MKTMAVTGWISLLAALLTTARTEAHNHMRETETYHVSAGHLFLLKCRTSGHVTWTRGSGFNHSLPSGVEVRNGVLWFMPVQLFHNGTYICEKRNHRGVWRMVFGLSVSPEKCPEPSEPRSVTLGLNKGIPCNLDEIFKLNIPTQIQWMKDCHPFKRQGDPVIVDEDNGFMRFPKATQRDAGIYTCLVDIRLNGTTYTAARTTRLDVDNDTVSVEPQVVSPQHQVVMVEVGTTVELQCLAYTGFSEDEEVTMYWTVNGNDSDEFEEFNESVPQFVHHRGRTYALSTLSISKVHRHFLDISICCHVMNPVGWDEGELRLQEANHSFLYTSVVVCIAASVIILVLAVFFFFFRVDLVLTYRKLLGMFSKQQAPDENLYDAYVTIYHSDASSSSEVMSFAFQLLPDKLEKQHGYSLYIRGRDDCPGEAMHDAIAATLHRCRRMIIILSAEAKSSTGCKTEEVSPLSDGQNRHYYEQKIGLYDALIQNKLQVILVEIDGPVDYTCLPESLRYIKRKQGVLKWKPASSGSHKLTRLYSNRNFWKHLRYHMPSVPTGKIHTMV
ncbi:interleukin-1 receptor type 1-like [Sphaeramia orbicularis]|uniref:Interleukin-1 receptor type 1-like n=1 Tax=Sphaeramia orbicularis TaxID=375764 RepID=A0A673AKZ7_9TELE|nr:interleukin-1 receptor type 1-like [Sphaeramia orbicularis]